MLSVCLLLLVLHSVSTISILNVVPADGFISRARVVRSITSIVGAMSTFVFQSWQQLSDY